MHILFLGKRHYTGKDALLDRFGRIHELPHHWHASGSLVTLTLLDYRSLAPASDTRDGFSVNSLPIADPSTLFQLRSLVRSLRPDLIVASGDCFIGLLGWDLARRSGTKFVFDVYDDYRQFGGYKLFAGLDAYGFLCRRSDLVLYASVTMAATHESKACTQLAPNGVDPTFFRPVDQTEAQERVDLFQPGTKWVGYFGGMDALRGAPDLVEAVGLIHQRDERVRLVLCGPTNGSADFERPWVENRGQIAHSLVPSYINACDVVTLPYRRGRLIDRASSCKIAEYLFCERPIVASRSPNMLDNFPIQSSQLEKALCEPGNIVDLARAIQYQLDNRIIATVPKSHTWHDISAETLRAMEAILQ